MRIEAVCREAATVTVREYVRTTTNDRSAIDVSATDGSAFDESTNVGDVEDVEDVELTMAHFERALDEVEPSADWSESSAADVEPSADDDRGDDAARSVGTDVG